LNLGWKTENAWAATLEKREKGREKTHAHRRASARLREGGTERGTERLPSHTSRWRFGRRPAPSHTPDQTPPLPAHAAPLTSSSPVTNNTRRVVCACLDTKQPRRLLSQPRTLRSQRACSSTTPQTARRGTTILKKITSRITPKNTTKTTSMLITTYLLYCTNLLYPAQACNLQLTRMSRR